MRGPIERGDSVSLTSSSGTGRSSTVSQCTPGGDFSNPDVGCSGRRVEEKTPFRLGVDGDPAPPFKAGDAEVVTGCLRVFLDTDGPDRAS